MNYLVVLTSVVVVAIAQRPGYLGSGPIGYPGLASRFKDDSQPSSSVSVNNRLGGNGGTTPKIPVDARGDVDLVVRLNNWPRENRPFWFLNADAIEAQRNPQGTTNTQGFQQQNLQGRFGGQQSGFEPNNFDSFDDFGNPVETRTIRPVLTRGSFAGSGPII